MTRKTREYAYSKSRKFDVHVMAREGKYAMVRRADSPSAMPFVLSLGDLETLPNHKSPQSKEAPDVN